MTTLHGKTEAMDPTRSGPPMPAGQGAQLSQNEIDQLCLKAARGAGMSWGQAEEAGFAAAWLAMRGLDGPGVMLAQLRAAMGRPWRDICPVVTPGCFRAECDGSLCPVALGTALCDYAGLPETDMGSVPLAIGPVTHPLLLLPFLADLARTRGDCVRFGWSRGAVLLGAKGGLSGDADLLAGEARVEAELSIRHGAGNEPAPTRDPLLVPAQTLQGLNAFAMRTTVPATEASRAGAGAASGDND